MMRAPSIRRDALPSRRSSAYGVDSEEALAALILVALAAGLVVAGIPLWFRLEQTTRDEQFVSRPRLLNGLHA